MTPTRIADTRSSQGTCTPSCGQLPVQSPVKFQVTGKAGIPPGATAVVGFVTLFQPTGTGYSRVNPTGTSSSSATGTGGSATINYNNGEGRGNMIMVPLAADGTITIASTTATHLILDVAAYYSAPATDAWNYAYGVDGIRSKKQHGTDPAVTYTWADTGGLPLLIGQHQNGVDTWIISGPGGQPIEELTATTPTYLHRDQLGSVRVATNQSGATVSTRSWDPYGNPTTNTGTTQPLLGYAGQYTDTETGNQYLRARYYDPATAQFLTRDPLVATTQDPYGYAGNNPVNATDPTGLFGIPEWVPVVGGKCVDIADPDCHSKKDEIVETLTGPGEKSLCASGQAYFVFGAKLDLCLDWNSSQGLSSMRPSISPGGGIGSPSLGAGISASSHDGACTNSDLGGLGTYVGGSAGFVGGQYAENTAPGSDRVRTTTVSVGKSWFPIPEAHAGFDYTWTMNR